MNALAPFRNPVLNECIGTIQESRRSGGSLASFHSLAFYFPPFSGEIGSMSSATGESCKQLGHPVKQADVYEVWHHSVRNSSGHPFEVTVGFFGKTFRYGELSTLVMVMYNLLSVCMLME